MSPTSLRLVALLATAACLGFGQQPKSQSKATVSGVFVGRTGKPMVQTRLIVAEVAGDANIVYARVKLPESLPTTITDDKGQFQFAGVPPGMYAVLYQPPTSTSKVLPAEINIKALAAVAKSPFPLLHNTQIGDSGTPNPERVWGKTFTLLKGHTFYAEGEFMKIWNASARWGPQGPQMEIRKGLIVREQFNDKGQLKLVAWSY
jgi:hypothetical protein